MVDPALQLVAVLALFLVFAGAALSKMAAWAELQGVVQNYRLLPASLVPAVSWLLPPAELALAAALLVPATRAAAATGMAVLLLVFAAAMGINLLRGRSDIDCGCFRSALKQTLSWWLVVRNLLLVALAAACVVPAGERVLAVTDWVTVLAGAASLFLVYLSTGNVTRRPPASLEEVAAARAGKAAAALRPSSKWKTL